MKMEDDDEFRRMTTTMPVRTNGGGNCKKRGCQRIRGLWTTLPGRTRTVFCKTSTVLCAFIICVHAFVVYSINASAAVNAIAGQQSSSVVAVQNSRIDDSTGEGGGGTEVLSRVKRELEENGFGSLTGEGGTEVLSRVKRELEENGVGSLIDEENISKETVSRQSQVYGDAQSTRSDEESEQEVMDPLTKKSFERTGDEEAETPSLINTERSSRNPSPSYPVCRSGHIQGFSDVCEAQPCLRQLTSPSSITHSDFHQSPSTVKSPSSQVLRRINHITGSLDTVHFSLVPFVTNFQWSNGIYGTVAEFGVSMGKFAALLSAYTDVDAGERFFVADSFNRSTGTSRPPISGLSPFQIFSAHLKDFGFSEGHSGPRKLHVHRGTHSAFDRQSLARWDLPQFRIVSIDADDLDLPDLSIVLETVACLLRDGGIVIVNGIDDAESRQSTNSVLFSFFAKHGQSALTPILSAGNKLYLTTTNWKRKYIQSLSNDVLLTHVGVVQSYDISRETLSLTVL